MAEDKIYSLYEIRQMMEQVEKETISRCIGIILDREDKSWDIQFAETARKIIKDIESYFSANQRFLTNAENAKEGKNGHR